MATLFISDLHLCQSRPEKLKLFKQLLEGPARQAKALYILGDLFERFWIGVDDPRPPNPEIIELLQAYSSIHGTRLVIMRGNRDFHLDRRFASATGCELVNDPMLIQLDGEKTLIMHGDALCTDDAGYQRWRKFILNPIIKYLNLHLPFVLRQRIATNVRKHMRKTVRQKSPYITDVSQQTVLRVMQDFGVKTLIHGHTHRQAMHEVSLPGTGGQRIVLGDWYEKDCVLVKDGNGFRFERIADFIAHA